MTQTHRLCPILMIAAPASHQGKTLFTASLARSYRQKGYHVKLFKIGPDFLDPKILEQASGHYVDNLDLWIMGEKYCRDKLIEARKHYDLVLIESVMGLFDHKPSNADFAQQFNIPILLLIDASSMGASFAAIAYGMTQLQTNLVFKGIIANRVGSQNHQELIQEKLPKNISLLAALPRDKHLQLPERHLGLYQPHELKRIDYFLDYAADIIDKNQITEKIFPDLAKQPFLKSSLSIKQKAKYTIAIAKDPAFSFIYPENIKTLHQLGFQTLFFSPINDSSLPKCDALWLPGGYPELYTKELAANTAMQCSIIEHSKLNKPIYAECGGMLYLFETVTTQHNKKYSMCGLLSGQAIMEKRFQGIGLQELTLFDTNIRGHSFHHARIETSLKPMQISYHQRKNKEGECFYSKGNIQASFLHLWFKSSLRITQRLFQM